jgi:hypothetical protein
MCVRLILPDRSYVTGKFIDTGYIGSIIRRTRYSNTIYALYQKEPQKSAGLSHLIGVFAGIDDKPQKLSAPESDMRYSILVHYELLRRQKTQPLIESVI